MVSNAKVVVGDVVKIHNWYGVVLETHFVHQTLLRMVQNQHLQVVDIKLVILFHVFVSMCSS